MDIAPLEYIVSNILPAVGLGMLGAPPKSYKSYMCIDMSICVAEGAKFMGFDTKKCDVLYLDLESTRRRPRDRINQITSHAPNNFYIVTAEQAVARIGEGLEQQLEEELEKHPEIGLIIIDVLKKVRPAQKRGVNDYDRDYEDLGTLKRFADSHGICILVVHHTRKMKDPSDPFNELAGSTAVLGTLDAAFVISKQNRDDKEAKLYVTGRDTEPQTLAVRFNQNLFKWENLGDFEAVERNKLIEEYNSSRIVQVVKRLLAQSNGEFTHSAQDLIKASQYIGDGSLKIYDSEQKVGKDLLKYIKCFDEVDGITVIKNGGTSHKNRGWTFKEITCPLCEHAPEEQQSLDL